MSQRAPAGQAAIKVLLAVAAGLLAGAGGYTFFYAEGLSYLSDDPRACLNCHIMREQYEGWRKASHHAAAGCNGCHVPAGFPAKWLTKASNGYHHSKTFTLQDFQEPIRIKPGNAAILAANCLRCHGDLVGEIMGRRPAGTEAPDCLRCHADVGHGPGR
ncbi:MAG: cytochrome c nitrite reductase small subunit [Candidatus Aminicenantes bacterium]|nr:cytochrome c nitrite reductase small subunit [Candidatus Aminicenantes bacterium]